jgi:Tfp pilus assembly protein PilV
MRNNDVSGLALLELLLACPLLLLIAYSIFAFAMLLTRHEQISTISRESASSALRSCTEIPVATTQACADSIASDFVTLSRLVAPDIRVLISVYKYDPTTKAVSRVALAPSLSTVYTKFDADAIPPGILSADKESLAISEVFHRPSGFVNSLLMFVMRGDHGEIYETTLF